MIRKSGYRCSERSCSNKKIERDDDSKKSHPALTGAVDGIHDPSPERGNSPITRLLGARHQINRLGGTGVEIKGSDQLLAESWPRLDQGCHCERDAKAVLGGLQHRRDAIEPKLTARGHFRNSGLLEPERTGARL